MSTPLDIQSLKDPSVEANRKDYVPLQHIFCPICKKDQHVNEQNYQVGTGTYLCCLLWCFVGMIPGLIPFCCNHCKDQVVKCSTCNHIIKKQPYEPCECDSSKRQNDDH